MAKGGHHNWLITTDGYELRNDFTCLDCGIQFSFTKQEQIIANYENVRQKVKELDGSCDNNKIAKGATS